MKKNRLQQQTLDRFFQPTAVRRTPAPANLSTNVLNHEVINVDEEAMNEVLHSAPPSAPLLTAPPPQEKVWRLGQQQVIFPWSPLNTRTGANGETSHVWDSVMHILRVPHRVASSDDLCSLMAALDRLVDGPGNAFEALRHAVRKMPSNKQTYLYDEVLPWMKETVLRGPALFGDRTIPLLVQGETRRLVLCHEEVVTLMCCCFFSLFPQRSEPKKNGGARREGARGGWTSAVAAGAEGSDTASMTASAAAVGCGGPRTMWMSRKLPCCNFSSLFSCGAKGRDASLESKIRGFIEYFFCCHRHDAHPLSVAHQRCLELTRVSHTDFPKFEESVQPLARVSMRRTGLIEKDAVSLQVDFANRFVGGGVLRSGCVQEEIRFTLAPEMALSRLVCEELTESEVLFISGAPNFCVATGYAEKFRFQCGCDPWVLPGEAKEEEWEEGGASQMAMYRAPPLMDANAIHPRTQQPLLIHDVCVVAMDAYNFRVRGQPADQYHLPLLRRELRKAYVGFRGVPAAYAVLPTVRSGPIASGHWGCGAFCGDKEWKLLLQWCAASEAGGRPLHYFTFETPLNEFDALQEKLLSAGWTVGRLVQTMILYDAYRGSVTEGETMCPFEFVVQAC
jgi:poly(ADP-ribose) glycohydrolase